MFSAILINLSILSKQGGKDDPGLKAAISSGSWLVANVIPQPGWIYRGSI